MGTLRDLLRPVPAGHPGRRYRGLLQVRISQGDERSIKATGGSPSQLLSSFIGRDLSDSQADGASSILVTRSRLRIRSSDGLFIPPDCAPRDARLRVACPIGLSSEVCHGHQGCGPQGGCPFTGSGATRRRAAVVELLVQVEHACGSCPMSLAWPVSSRVTWCRGCGL